MPLTPCIWLQTVSFHSDGSSPAQSEGEEARTTRLEIQEDNTDGKVQSERQKGLRWEQGRGGVILTDHNNKTNAIVGKQTSKSDGKRVESTTFFPFEEAVEEDAVVQGGPSQCNPQADSDDDFVDPPTHDRGKKRRLESDILRSESEARAARKRRAVEREVALRQRQAEGKKPYYIMVSPSGTPYGDGMSAWKMELNKLCRALDPTIRDIRQQPHQKIQLLKKRLTDNFDYSGIISDRFILPLIGRRLSTIRHKIINEIKSQRPCPPGVKLEHWEKLKRYSESESYHRKSEAMKRANAGRQTLGRTGPGGEIGVRESLKVRFSRSPDPDEVRVEMSREKGYGGRKKQKLMKILCNKQTSPSSAFIDESGADSQPDEELHLKSADVEADPKSQENYTGNVRRTSVDQMTIIKKMQAQIEELQAQIHANLAQTSGSQQPRTTAFYDCHASDTVLTWKSRCA